MSMLTGKMLTPTPLAKECPHCQEYIDEKDFDQHVKDCPPTCEWYKDYDEFWKPLLEKDGVLDMNQLKKELYDYNKALKNVSKVYMHITSDKLSKINYDADTVISEADQCESDRTEEAIKDELESLGYLNEGESVEEQKARIRKSLLAFELKPNTLLVVKFQSNLTDQELEKVRMVFVAVLEELKVDVKAVILPDVLDVTSYDITKDTQLIISYPEIATESQIAECKKVLNETNIKVVWIPKVLEVTK